MKVLIVYENVPESTDIYLVDIEEADWQWMKLTHGNFINASMSDEEEAACQKLNEFLENKEKYTVKEPVVAEGIAYVLLTGFIC